MLRLCVKKAIKSSSRRRYLNRNWPQPRSNVTSHATWSGLNGRSRASVTKRGATSFKLRLPTTRSKLRLPEISRRKITCFSKRSSRTKTSASSTTWISSATSIPPLGLEACKSIIWEKRTLSRKSCLSSPRWLRMKKMPKSRWSEYPWCLPEQT